MDRIISKLKLGLIISPIFLLTGCDPFDRSGTIDCSSGTCIIDIDHWFTKLCQVSSAKTY